MVCLFSVDSSLCISYDTILAPMKDMARRHIVSWERGRCPRAGLQPAPGRLGYQSPGTMTGTGGASLDWDRRRRVTPVQTASQEAWPEADLGDEILLEMRAVVERRQACALQKGARRIARCGGCDPAFAGVPLPSIYFVARMERSVIRERWSSETAAPDCAALHPGYKTWRDGRSE
jgi:hypothetical protein